MGEHKPPPLPGEWLEDAACRGHPPAYFYPSVGEVGHSGDYTPALEICRTCPVTEPCGDYAIEHIDKARPFGVWGGMTPRQRDEERQRRNARSQTA